MQSTLAAASATPVRVFLMRILLMSGPRERGPRASLCHRPASASLDATCTAIRPATADEPMPTCQPLSSPRGLAVRCREGVHLDGVAARDVLLDRHDAAPGVELSLE